MNIKFLNKKKKTVALDGGEKNNNNKAQLIADDETVTTAAASSLDESSKHTAGDHDFSLFQCTIHESQNIEISNHNIHLESLQENATDLWYDADETQRLKEQNAFSSKVARSSSGYVSAVDSVYQACQQEQAPSVEAQQALKSQLKLQPAKVGLEHKVVKGYHHDKLERRERLVQLACYSDDNNNDSSSGSLLLAEECAQVSKPAALLAAHIAQAQADAAE
eukprot:CAMPEP_0168756822 /NCGR_PEP_ID=MMETSP0724-20121128/20826_1 /TAXON_ID=265536 /ORGANISM="Amphiprora sp., Strain CCMP467" /LENGTH=220 /DNA_ID=CAMNT_0008805567 /DNA_START=13 /DNA_END=675 /DNA_ORIENTATION=+